MLSGILKKSDGFGFTNMDSYRRPEDLEDSFKQFRDLADVLQNKQSAYQSAQRVKFEEKSLSKQFLYESSLKKSRSQLERYEPAAEAGTRL